MLKASGRASKMLAVLLLLAPFATLSLVAAIAASPFIALVTAAWVLLFLVAAVLVVVEAVVMMRRGDAAALGGSARLVKYAGIPFFTTNFVLLASVIGGVLLISSLFAAGVVTGAMAAIAVPILVTGTYLIMLPTSAYGITGAILLRRQGRASTAFAVLAVISHLIFVVDIFATLVVADRAMPGPRSAARRVRWIAGVAVMALLVPTALFLADTPGRLDRQQAEQQLQNSLSSLPGVARVEDRTVVLAPGITAAQAHTIALTAYPLQDNNSPADSSRWTLAYGSARLVLKDTDEVSTQALLVLGPAVLGERFRLKLTTRSPDPSGEPQTVFTYVENLVPSDGKDFTTVAATVVRTLALADPQAAGSVGSLSAVRWGVNGDRLRSSTTADQLDALGAMLSDAVELESLSLASTSSKVTLTVRKDAQIGPACQLALAALGDFPGLTLKVHTGRTSDRDAQEC